MEDFVSQLKEDIQCLCQKKYGHVYVDFDVLKRRGHERARVQFTISDDVGFITRHYGEAGYTNQKLFLHTMSI